VLYYLNFKLTIPTCVPKSILMFANNPIPIVDFAKAREGGKEEKEAVAKEINGAFREVGFVYLKNHGVGQEMVREGFEWVSPFLALYHPTSISKQSIVQEILQSPSVN
jgi:isopenicillin N synthase-like dioxygenase